MSVAPNRELPVSIRPPPLPVERASVDGTDNGPIRVGAWMFSR
ncbi:MAG: hypothetical protein R2882_08965 [Gemmatimonadales bacterium]